ncbi:MAG: alpha/beta family hydrolase [Ornithinimicrobium sp.]
MSSFVTEILTTQGLARVHHYPAQRSGSSASGTVLLGHGAGGGVGSADLQALTSLAGHGWHVALIEQPWRVASRRIAVAPPALDMATSEILEALAADEALVRPWVLGGRSAGARVACRLSHTAQACLLIAFPLVPTRRDGSLGPSRGPELVMPLAAGIPTLVLQGHRDPFGSPSDITAVVPDARVVSYRGDHSVPRDPGALVTPVGNFLNALT